MNQSETCFSNHRQHRCLNACLCVFPFIERVLDLMLVTAPGLWAIAAASPDRTAVIEPDGRVVSYGELARDADSCGRGLQALGLRPGSSVATLLPNAAPALAVYFAALQTGLYVVPVNWHLVGAEVAYILNDCGAEAFVADERFGGDAVEGGGAPRAAGPVAIWPLSGFSALRQPGAD